MRSEEFWNYFNNLAKPHLDHRAESFEQIFNYLDKFNRPVGIIETGCVRVEGNWAGDGCSTILFDIYAKHHPGSTVFTVDLAPEATKVCRELVSNLVKIHTGDSVPFLKSLVDNRPQDLAFVDLLYLDSYDVDFYNPTPSAVHHLKELVAIAPLLRDETLVVVDDSPREVLGSSCAGKFRMAANPRISGKGMYVAEYATQVNAKNLFASYQCGWTHMGNNPPKN